MANKKFSELTAWSTPIGADYIAVVDSVAVSTKKTTFTQLFGYLPGALVLATTDGGALGSATKMWSDLFLASGSVINFNNGDVTITHSANTLAFAGGSSYTFDATITPAASDGGALGTGTLMWSDLFLASASVINFNNGDVTITHSANNLALAGATDYTFDNTLLIGATAEYGRLSQRLEVNSAAATRSGMAINTWNNSAGDNGPIFDFNVSKSGVVGTHTVVASGDILGGIVWRGSDGTVFRPAAWISGEVDGTPGDNDMPGRLILATTLDGAGSSSERVRIDNKGWLRYTMHDNTGTPVAATAALKFFAHNKSVVDDGIITLPTVTTNGYGVMACDTDVSERTQFWVDSTGTVTLINNAGSVVANADTDTNVCMGTAATQEPLQVKNRLGSAKVINILFWYD